MVRSSRVMMRGFYHAAAETREQERGPCPSCPELSGSVLFCHGAESIWKRADAVLGEARRW
jgi:hypothetical protein